MLRTQTYLCLKDRLPYQWYTMSVIIQSVWHDSAFYTGLFPPLYKGVFRLTVAVMHRLAADTIKYSH